MKNFTVTEADTLKRFTDTHYPQGSFFFDRLLKNKDIRVNGKKTDCNVSLQVGDLISYYLTEAQENKPAYYTVYEDLNVLVIDKESGVNSEAVHFTLLQNDPSIKAIHRLDRNTQGIMIFAKTDVAEKELLQLFRERKVEKKYLAVCVGSLPKKKDKLTAYLKKDDLRSEVTVYTDKRKDTEEIVTEYEVQSEEKGLSLVEITLHTGKTHQIRAHMAYIGAPVLGDTKYGDKVANTAYSKTRQCLIAKSLSVSSCGMLSYLSEKVFLSRFSFSLPL